MARRSSSSLDTSARSPLFGEKVVIVGGGVIGVTTAFYLAKKGAQVPLTFTFTLCPPLTASSFSPFDFISFSLRIFSILLSPLIHRLHLHYLSFAPFEFNESLLFL